MQVRMLCALLGDVNGQDASRPGNVIELNETDARAMVDAGQAEPVDEQTVTPTVTPAVTPTLWPGVYRINHA